MEFCFSLYLVITLFSLDCFRIFYFVKTITGATVYAGNVCVYLCVGKTNRKMPKNIC